MPNVASYIKAHNAKVIRKSEKEPSKKGCNCPPNKECPLQGNCLVKSVIYRANVTTDNPSHENSYIGLTEQEFKGRERFHEHTFRKEEKQTSTKLSSYIWKLKREYQKSPKVTYSILEKSQPYNNGSKRCVLCLSEKYHIIFQPFQKLNLRNELVSKCRHENKFYLKNFIS